MANSCTSTPISCHTDYNLFFSKSEKSKKKALGSGMGVLYRNSLNFKPIPNLIGEKILAG